MQLPAFVLIVGIITAVSSRSNGLSATDQHSPANPLAGLFGGDPKEALAGLFRRGKQDVQPLTDVQHTSSTGGLFGLGRQEKLDPKQRRKLKQLFLKKLSKVPVYLVTTEDGSPYLEEDMGQLSGEHYMYSARMHLNIAGAEAAKAVMDKQAVPDPPWAPNRKKKAENVKILATNLERALSLYQAPPMDTGIDHPDLPGSQANMVYNFGKKKLEIFKPNTWMRRNQPRMGYMGGGLCIRKGKRNVWPIYLSKEDCDAAMAKRGVKNQYQLDAVSKLSQIYEDIERGSPDVAEQIATLEVIPPSSSLKYQRSSKKDADNQAGKRRSQIVLPKES